MKKYDRQSSFRTQVKTEDKRQAGYNDATLSSEEEKVIRMLQGFSEPDDKVLEYAVGASEDARYRMALMEVHNIADLNGDVPIASGGDAYQALLDEIVERYGDD